MSSETLDYRDIVVKNIIFLMNAYGKSRKEVCADLDIRYSTFSDWLNGHSSPKLDSIEQLSYYFRIGISDFLIDIAENHMMAERILAYAKRIGVCKMKKDSDIEIKKNNEYTFRHRTLKERAAEYGGKLGPYKEMDFGTPVGRERW